VDAKALPTKIRFLNWGENPNAKNRRVALGRRAVAFHEQPTCGFRRIALDFEHNTLPGTPAFAASAEPRPVAGFGDLRIVPGDGAYLDNIEYTPTGREMALNYTDVSAGALLDDAGEVAAIVSVALCRNGCVPGMEFSQVPLSADMADLLAGAGVEETNKEKPIMRDMLIKLLGLKPEATDDDVANAVKALVDKPAPVPMGVDLEKLRTEIDAKFAGFSAVISALNKKDEKREKDALLMGARAEGKLVALSADLVEKLGVEDLKTHIAGLSVTLPVTRTTPEKVAETGLSTGGAITDAQKAVALSCGMDPETVFGTPKK
jgi:phage I-like protein